jgi:hypothetical protein
MNRNELQELQGYINQLFDGIDSKTQMEQFAYDTLIDNLKTYSEAELTQLEEEDYSPELLEDD